LNNSLALARSRTTATFLSTFPALLIERRLAERNLNIVIDTAVSAKKKEKRDGVELLRWKLLEFNKIRLDLKGERQFFRLRDLRVS